jgi:uncharacterized integral membrane protein
MKDFCLSSAYVTRNNKMATVPTFNMTYLLTAVGLTPGGISTVHIYTQTIHRTTQSTQTIYRTTQLTNWEE